jgi:hypothetical protein
MSLTKVTYSMIQGAPVNVLDYGADPTGVSDSTAAIDAAIASGKSVYFPAGTYMTTGNHNITFPSYQSFFGDFYGSTTIKKISGTNRIFNIVQFAQCSFDNLTIDGNSLAGNAVFWRAHYSVMSNMFIKNIGGTSPAIHISGSNLCTFDNVNINNCVGGDFRIDQSTDPSAVIPAYGMLYSTFNHCSSSPAPNATGSSLLFGGSIIANITFNDFYFESPTGSTGVPIHFNSTCSAVFGIAFNQPSCEVFNTGTPIIYLENATIYNISFFQGNFGVSANRANPFISATAIEGLEIVGCSFTDLFSTTPEIIRFEAVTNGVIKDSGVSCANNFTFFNDAGYNNFITLQNNNVRAYASGPGLGKNTWTASTLQANYSSSTSSQFTDIAVGSFSTPQLPNLTINNTKDQHSQSTCGFITVADDGFYDVYGNGGTTSPANDFMGVLTITGTPTNRAVVTATANNFATFYAQSATSASAQSSTAITVGSNVEIDVLGNSATAALANTTDGKLGVQIGGGSEITRFIRIYNRTGASIVLNVDVKAFK